MRCSRRGARPCAAKRLGVTQSAVSNALVRLRELVQDPLVVRRPRSRGDPQGGGASSSIGQALGELGALLSREVEFDPLTTTREFILACADYYGMVVLPSLTSALRERAPFATLRIVSLERLVSYGGLADDVDLHVGAPLLSCPGVTARRSFTNSSSVSRVEPRRPLLPRWGFASMPRRLTCGSRFSTMPAIPSMKGSRSTM